uniref:CCHC-type domain-containing protein n=1 Tax=Tanacetum cinerariifolium TaxID=118510 RepID=A0A6L2JH58_TANCI|nr:hypothetical protein [Tanacetum cinerariifolium]
MASQDARLSKFEANFKQKQSEVTNKIDTFLKAINDRMMEELPSDTIKSVKLNVNPTFSVSSARSYQMAFQVGRIYKSNKKSLNAKGKGKRKGKGKDKPDVDVDNFKRCCTSYTFLVEYRVLIDLILHRSSINSYARLSNKFGGFYFIFKFGISGLLHQVITTIADRIRVFYEDQSSSITCMQQPQPNNNFIPQPSFNTNYMQQPMPNPNDITDPTTAMNMELVLMAKAFKLNYSTPTNNNHIISSNPRNRQIAQLVMNLGQDKQMQMVRVQNVRNLVVQNAVQNPGVRNVRNHNGLIVVPGIANPNANQNGNGNVVAARAEGNGNGNNENQIRCYNCRGLGHLARNCTVRPRKKDAAYLQTQLLIAQKKEAGIQLQA